MSFAGQSPAAASTYLRHEVASFDGSNKARAFRLGPEFGELLDRGPSGQDEIGLGLAEPLGDRGDLVRDAAIHPDRADGHALDQGQLDQGGGLQLGLELVESATDLDGVGTLGRRTTPAPVVPCLGESTREAC